MTSIRQQVFTYINNHPDITLKALKKVFKDCPTNTIRAYFRQHFDMSDNITIDIKKELIKIIKDYKTPASSRVQAIREYNNIVESIPTEGEDPYLKYLQTLEKQNSKTQIIEDSSSITLNYPTKEKTGNTPTKTKNSA